MQKCANCLQRASSSMEASAVAVAARGLKTASSSVDSQNLAVFKNIPNSEWMNERAGSFKSLHALNRLRVPWITSYFRKQHSAVDSNVLSGLRLLDVGCGGGLLTNTLSRLGAEVVGLDANEAAVRLADEVATNTLKRDQRARVKFECAPIEEYAVRNAGVFDGVIASEVVEHVSDVSAFVGSCVALAKPGRGSKLFFTTINRTLVSRVLVIWMAEDLLSLVPKGVHDWRRFVEPSELRSVLIENNCRCTPPLGMLYNPLTNAWSWTDFSAANYAMVATRT